MEGQKSSSSTSVLIVITVIITAVIVGGGVYFWQKYSQTKSSLEKLQTSPSPSYASPIATSEPTKTLAPEESPRTVVSNYLKHTLGTIPGADYNENMARTYLAPALRSQFTDASFIPLSYGIQEGPEDVEVVSENISDSTATVIVNGIYGNEVQKIWTFELITIDNEWKISKIEAVEKIH